MNIVSIVGIIVGIVVVDLLAEFHSRIFCGIVGRDRISGVVYLQGRCCRNFGRM